MKRIGELRWQCHDCFDVLGRLDPDGRQPRARVVVEDHSEWCFTCGAPVDRGVWVAHVPRDVVR